MLIEIDDFYQAKDGNDWSPAIQRAQNVHGSGATLYFHPRDYNFSDTIHLVRGMSLVGSGAGPNTSATRLIFPPGVSGIICEFPQPDGPPVDGAGSIIERLAIMGDPRTDMIAHGVVMNARAILRNILIQSFSGDGIHIYACHGYKPNSGAPFWQVHDCWVLGCKGNGFYAHGCDSNVGCAIGLLCQDNLGWGVLDESDTTNTYIACHVENSSASGNKGYRAAGLIPADEANPQPYRRPTGSVFVSCSLEGVISEIEAPNAVIGGRLANGGNPPNSGMLLSHAVGIAEFPNSVAGGNQQPSVAGLNVFGVLGASLVQDTALELWTNFLDVNARVYRLMYSTKENPFTISDPPGYLELKYAEGSAGPFSGSILCFSTSLPDCDLPANNLWMPIGYYIGEPKFAARVHVTTGRALPTSGTAQKGDRILNADPVPGDHVKGFAGWICINSSSPANPAGQWAGFGRIEPL